MKKLQFLSHMFLAIVLTTSIFLSGCTSSTKYGECIGLFDKSTAEKAHPDLIYKLSGWNTFVAIFLGPPLLFIPTIFVVKDETFCPEDRIELVKPVVEEKLYIPQPTTDQPIKLN